MRRPSAALVVSSLALFVALGGTSYAISQLPPNSVGNKQLRTGAVTSSKIKDGTISRKDLAAGTALKGDAGPQGLTGAQGATGPQGATGSQGTTGPQGATGPQGDVGPQGPQGVAGLAGTARAYGYIKADGTLNMARSSANVTGASLAVVAGGHCISITGLNPSTAVMLVDTDFDTDSTSISSSPTVKAFAEPRSSSVGCSAGQFYVLTMKLTNSSPVSMVTSNEPFFFAVP
jgi:hypothetical protein